MILQLKNLSHPCSCKTFPYFSTCIAPSFIWCRRPWLTKSKTTLFRPIPLYNAGTTTECYSSFISTNLKVKCAIFQLASQLWRYFRLQYKHKCTNKRPTRIS